jgi:SAM-dependent methyltransferase
MRTTEQIREHYQIEKEIAKRLRDSTNQERAHLYTSAYDELFRQIPHESMLDGVSREQIDRAAKRELTILQKFVNGRSIYMEVGPGDCTLALKMAKRVKKVYAVDVSTEITKNVDAPSNFELCISNGISIPVEPESVDVVHSNQLMEHLHPDDAAQQLEHIYRSLKPGGIYYCVTPNRLSGPHDISRNFDPVATCLHLKEYTIGELNAMFRDAGFRKRRIYLGYGSFGVFLHPLPLRIAESFLAILPHRLRKLITFNRGMRLLLGIRIIGEKQALHPAA